MDRLDEIRARCEAARPVVFVDVPIRAETRVFLEHAKSDMTYLLAEVERLTANRWIPVGERLPEDEDGEVLVIASGKPHKNITLDGAYMLATYSRPEGWILDEYPEWECANVTHWRPLPEPPKEAHT